MELPDCRFPFHNVLWEVCCLVALGWAEGCGFEIHDLGKRALHLLSHQAAPYLQAIFFWAAFENLIRVTLKVEVKKAPKVKGHRCRVTPKLVLASQVLQLWFEPQGFCLHRRALPGRPIKDVTNIWHLRYQEVGSPPLPELSIRFSIIGRLLLHNLVDKSPRPFVELPSSRLDAIATCICNALPSVN